MTAQDIYALALSFLSETTQETNDVQQFTLGWLNILLQECLPYENAWRKHKKQEELTSAPTLTAFTDTVPYDDHITRIAMPYGLAAWYWADDDNDFRSQDYRGRYISALDENTPYLQSSVEDYYGRDEDCQD